MYVMYIVCMYMRKQMRLHEYKQSDAYVCICKSKFAYMHVRQ